MPEKESSSTPMNYPTLLGVYVAINAIKGATVLVDGPDCTLYKAHFIHGRHDLNSTLLQLDGAHRVCFTNVCSRGVVKEHDDVLRDYIGMVDAIPENRLQVVTALPMCSITGVDYGRAIRNMGDELKHPAFDIPPDSLIGDWIDGYSQVMNCLAKMLNFTPDLVREGTCAIVGNMFDRNEADHQANVKELKRMLKEAFGLEVVSVWLSGTDVFELNRAQEAEYIIQLPYGKAAARKIIEATGAQLIETKVPFGLPLTQQFLRDVGKGIGRENEAEVYIRRELQRVIPVIKWVVPHVFLHRKVAFVGDPHQVEGFQDICDDLGMSCEGVIVRGRRAHGGGKPGTVILHEPPVFTKKVRNLMRKPLDLLVTSYLKEWPNLSYPTMEFGFPAYHYHALFDAPFLGFNGFLGFVDRLSGFLFPVPRRKEGAHDNLFHNVMMENGAGNGNGGGNGDGKKPEVMVNPEKQIGSGRYA